MLEYVGTKYCITSFNLIFNTCINSCYDTVFEGKSIGTQDDLTFLWYKE